MLEPLRQTDPSWTTSESPAHGFVECATWADEIKKLGAYWQSNWHFVNQPFFNEGGSLDDYPDFKLDPHNITDIVPNLVDWFNGVPGYENGYAYQTIMNHTYKVHTEEVGKSMAIRFLIHYVGDFQQPLHCTTLVNNEFPKGDRGGNSFKLPAEDQKELHAVWDSVSLEFANTGYANLPFSQQDWD